MYFTELARAIQLSGIVFIERFQTQFTHELMSHGFIAHTLSAL